MSQGVTCGHCGASTPLPDDLRVPSFRCSFCQVELQTAAYAGHEAIAADRLVAHLHAVVEKPSIAASTEAPRFETRNEATRPDRCKSCGAAVAVPLDLRTHQFTCGGCGRTQPVNQYVSDRERFELDMQRQVAGNQALAQLRAEGVACHRCGGKNDVPEGGAVQIACRYCHAAILLSDHVDASAVARARLKEGVFEMRDRLKAEQAARERRARVIALVAFAVVAAAIVVAGLLSR